MSEVQDRYWLRPTDLASDWVRLGEDVSRLMNGRSNCQVRLGVLVSSGAVDEIIEPEFATLENRKGEMQPGGNWWAVIRRIRSLAPDRGRSLITLSVIIDGLGNPVTWTTPQVLRVVGRK